MSDDENDDNGTAYEAYMRAGELSVGIYGETSEEARDSVMELWEKAIQDIDEMPDEKRQDIGLR